MRCAKCGGSELIAVEPGEAEDRTPTIPSPRRSPYACVVLIVLGDLVREGYGMSGHIAPISAWCAVDTNGRLLPNYCFADKAHVERSIPSGERWTAVRVVIDPARCVGDAGRGSASNRRAS